jgi:two-component system copper resistance phosphate regulon response regulator CusR
MRILVIEDEVNVAGFIRKGLEEQGHEISVAYDGETGLQLARQASFQLIILDVILPHLNGREVCRTLRQEGYQEVPILMLTALGTTEDVVLGLDAGADDYLKKPFQFSELLARIRALARRKSLRSEGSFLRIGDLEMDLSRKTVRRAGRDISLTAREFTLLEYLVENQGRVVSRVDILEQVWEIDFDPGSNVIDVYINYLRKKIDKGFDHPLIHTVVGMGYVIKSS